jgi:hypothetical protein
VRYIGTFGQPRTSYLAASLSSYLQVKFMPNFREKPGETQSASYGASANDHSGRFWCNISTTLSAWSRYEELIGKLIPSNDRRDDLHLRWLQINRMPFCSNAMRGYTGIQTMWNTGCVGFCEETDHMAKLRLCRKQTWKCRRSER